MLGIFLEYETQRINDALHDLELQRSDQENGEIAPNGQAASSMKSIFLKLVFPVVALICCILLG